MRLASILGFGLLAASCGGSSQPGPAAPSSESSPAQPAKAEPIEYSGIHYYSEGVSLFFPDYSCDPAPDRPGMVLILSDEYRQKMDRLVSDDEPVNRIDARFRGMLSTKGHYGPNGASPHRIVVVEVLELQDAEVCEQD